MRDLSRPHKKKFSLLGQVRDTGSRRDQEEGGELDSHEEVRHFCGSRRDQEDPQVSPEEIKSREVELGVKAGLFLHQLFLNSGATDIVFVPLFRTAVETAIAWYVHYLLDYGDRTLP